ncbi:MAG: tetratricopeptide repeat protein [Proteobacteria bacterium]|nr:tetratricopeptide repeat protein [Pseudomonadota bacterium]
MRVDFSEIHSKVKLYLSVGRFEAAEKLLKSSIDEHGSAANLRNLLGVTYHQQSKFAEAIIEFTKALKINNNFIEAGLNLSATYCDLGKYDDAKAVFSEIVAMTPANKKVPDLIMGRLANQHAATGHLYDQSSMPNEAIVEFKKALAIYDRMPDVRVALGKIYFRMSQFEKSLSEFQQVMSTFPSTTEAHIWSGLINWKLGHYDIAEQNWKTAITISGNSSIAAAYLRMSQEYKKRSKLTDK